MGVITWPLCGGLADKISRWKPMSDGVPEFGMRESERTRSGPSDESLAIQVRNSGDKTAFGIIVGRYRARITGLARKMIGAGHADEFWSLALMVRSLKSSQTVFAYDAGDVIPGGKHAGIEGRTVSW